MKGLIHIELKNKKQCPFLDKKVKDHMLPGDIIELTKDISETTRSAGIFKWKQTQMNSSAFS